MSDKLTIKPLAIAAGAAFITSLASTTVANAAENPFAMSDLSSGYMVADAAEGKCGEGKMMKEGEGKCGEGKCGEGKMKKEGEGKCGEGKCGEGKMKKEGEGMMKEGEGKCGGEKK
jgi:uncharacterized low-complexity protein